MVLSNWRIVNRAGVQIDCVGPTDSIPTLWGATDSALLPTEFWLVVGRTQVKAFLSGDSGLVLRKRVGEHTAECSLDRCIFH